MSMVACERGREIKEEHAGKREKEIFIG
jgi:hypothetical protein